MAAAYPAGPPPMTMMSKLYVGIGSRDDMETAPACHCRLVGGDFRSDNDAMTVAAIREPRREFRVGTLGWTADDLDNPKIERLWEKGRYEIVEGVLTEMPPAEFDSSKRLLRLVRVLADHVDEQGVDGSFAMEVDLIVSQRRVAVVDAVYLTSADERRQAALYAKKPNRKPRVWFGRLMIAPTLIIESISVGHEAHDRETKRWWHAEAGVKNYWLFDGMRRTLECLVLKGDDYVVQVTAKGNRELRPALFPGLVLPLSKLWR